MLIKRNTSLILNEGYEKEIYFSSGLGSKIFIDKKNI